MTARFRIRVAGGREITLDTLEAFVQRVQAGDIGPSDLVFDGLTGEWAPARSHPAFDLSVDPLVSSDQAEHGKAGQHSAHEMEAPDPLDDWSGYDEPTMDLVDIEESSPEEETRAFIARMEQERRSEDDLFGGRNDLRLVDSRSGTLSGVQPPPQRRTSPELTRTRRAGVSAPQAQARTTARVGAPPPAPRRGRWRWWAGFSLLLCVGLGASATVAWPALRTSGPFPRRESPPEARDTRPVEATESAIRGAADETFVRSIERLRRESDVGAVPFAWLQGRYLSDPTAYPEVQHYWERYLRFVETAHEREGEFYRDAYLNAEERAGIAGPMRSLRMAAAADDFASSRSQRDTIYAKVWKLAAAALSLHETLVALKGRISYEPLRGSRVSADPVIEAAGTDPDAQARLEAALDRVLAAMAPLQNGELTRRGARQHAPTWLVDEMRRVMRG